ncbi:MAG: hypothetical protein VB137_09770 [Burkholderia sp.]
MRANIRRAQHCTALCAAAEVDAELARAAAPEPEDEAYRDEDVPDTVV